jgi:uncharacterized protein
MKKLLIGLTLLSSMSAFALDEQAIDCAKSLTHNGLVETFKGAVSICKSTNDVDRSYAQKLEYFGHVDSLSEGLALSAVYSPEEIDQAMSLVRSGDFKNIVSALKVIKD